ncbi:hypothetical protein [Microbacterium awajiense]|uniref:hypothetical protein n=1 Tax=Microbacterium awajiense TaxID=415214 RepID=UPI0031D60887
MPARAVTSPQRTYRYLRIAAALTVPTILVAVAAAIPVVGVLPSISHYFYSPARTAFTAALIAASVCLLALSGRGAGRALLDAAALFPPLVAVIPVAVAPDSVPDVPVDVDSDCGVCVPAAFIPGVDNGMIVYLAVGALAVAIGAVLAARGEVARDGAVSLAVAGAVIATAGLVWWLAHPALLRWGHAVAAALFFALIAVTALVEALRAPAGMPRWLRTSYLVLAIALAVVLICTIALGDERFADGRPVLIGEAIALVLFAAFWVLQSAQHWRDPDPALRAP